MTSRDIREGYIEDLKYFYGSTNKVRKGKLSSSTRCIEPIDAMAREYAKESPITKAWSTESEFKQKVKEAKSFKKVINKKARAEAIRLLNK